MGGGYVNRRDKPRDVCWVMEREYCDSHGIGLKLEMSLIGDFLKFYTTFTPEHTAGRADCRSKILWLGWYPNPSTGRRAWLQKMASLGSIYPITRSLSWEVTIALDFYLMPKCPTSILVAFPSTFSHHPSTPVPSCSQLTHFPNLLPFPLHREVHASPIEPSLILSFSESIDYPFL